MNIVGIIQARMGSSRLPGKVLKALVNEKAAIELMLERVSRSSLINSLVVATSLNPENDPLEIFCHDLGVAVFRGDEDDVLDRFYQAAVSHKADVVVRLTGDCPLHDPEVIDKVVGAYQDVDVDYVSNINPPTYPDGLDVEVFSMAALTRAWHEAKKGSEREHVTPYIRERKDLFRHRNITGDTDYSHERWTLDQPEDLAFLTRVFSALYQENSTFTWQDVLSYLASSPNIRNLNAGINRNEGYLKSLEND